MSSKMTLGDPKMSSGSTPEHHPEHPKIPNAALEPLEARSSAPVHRNRPSPVASGTPWAPQPPSPPSPSYSYVTTLFLSPSPLPPRAPDPPGSADFLLGLGAGAGTGGWDWVKNCFWVWGLGLGLGAKDRCLDTENDHSETEKQSRIFM